MKRATPKGLRKVYAYAKTATVRQLKKGIIDYILDEIYDLSYCGKVFHCNDKETLIRYIEPLVRMQKTKNDYYRTFNEFPIKEYYYTPLFDEDTRNERIIKTKSQIYLENIKETCYFYSLRYNFDVHSLYNFMDNNRYMATSSSSDDESMDSEGVEEVSRKKYMKRNIISKFDKDTIKLTDYNDNLRVIIAPIFPQKRTSLELGQEVDLSMYRTMKRLPFSSFNYPIYFSIPEREFHNKLPFEFHIDEKIDNNMYIDRNIGRVIITELSLMEVYKKLHEDYVKYELGQDHRNGSAVATAICYYLLFDIDEKF